MRLAGCAALHASRRQGLPACIIYCHAMPAVGASATVGRAHSTATGTPLVHRACRALPDPVQPLGAGAGQARPSRLVLWQAASGCSAAHVLHCWRCGAPLPRPLLRLYCPCQGLLSKVVGGQPTCHTNMELDVPPGLVRGWVGGRSLCISPAVLTQCRDHLPRGCRSQPPLPPPLPYPPASRPAHSSLE